MPPQGFTIFDLKGTIDKYCELSPDIYTRAHYDAMLADREDEWNIASASWNWLRERLSQDTNTELKNIK